MVHVLIRDDIVFNHMNVLSAGACGAVRWHQRAQSVMEPECYNNHKGSELCSIANGHPLTLHRESAQSYIYYMGYNLLA